MKHTTKTHIVWLSLRPEMLKAVTLHASQQNVFILYENIIVKVNVSKSNQAYLR